LYEEFFKRVWIATLKKAKKDLLSEDIKIRNDALEWFLDDEFDVNTFYGVCFSLDFNPNDFRRKIFIETNITEKNIIEFLTERRKQKDQAKKNFIEAKKMQ